MTKIRVFELARSLNMTNKALMDKLGELDFSVASHLSSLEDHEVETIKKALKGTKAEKVEETRVRPTVIRRRKKAVAKKPVKKADDAAEEESLVSESPAPRETVEQQTEVEPASKKKAVKEEAVKEEAVAEPPAPDEPPEPAEDKPAEPVQETQDSEPSKPAPEDVKEPETEPAAEPEAKKAEPSKAKAAKKAKKQKKEAPAKIIKLPVKPAPEKVEKPPIKEDVPETPAEIEARRIAPPEPTALKPSEVEEKEKKKGRKKREDPTRDKKFFKKKISFLRKEVVEGVDLYSDEKIRGKKGRKGAKAKPAKGLKPQITTPKAIKRRIKIDETIILSDLAKRMGIKAGDMIKTLMAMGVMATVNQTIDFDTAVLVATEFGYEVEKASFEEETVLTVQEDDPDKLLPRSPVVTIMGHVDHGKTSLLDVIRKTRITEMEAGGITQHIGAYSVKTEKGEITFLDTPGHEAFTAMRSRGARVTDLVVLVVAADDGVMPQTIEAINHSKAAEVPIIVAVNKIDKANADVERVQRELSEHGLVPEDWGGDTIFVHVSAKQKTGIDELLEMILLQAEVLELKVNPNKLATGHVVEAKLDSGRGPLATVLVLEGTLRSGESVVCGVHHGKIRALINDRGVQVEVAGPATPVEVVGLSGVPMAGDELVAVADEKSAKQVSAHRAQKQRSLELAKSSRMSLEGLFEKMKEGEVKDLNLIIKADVHGSIEALKDSLTKLSTEEVRINVIHSATGTITETDVNLAAVSDAIILGFNVRPSAKVHELASEEHVDMRFYDVIYNAIKDIKDAILGMMSSIFEERVLGRADVRQVFHIPKMGAVAGSYVTDGRIERGQLIRLLRDGIVMYEGKISSLRRFKDDVKEVQNGYECGIGIEKYNDIKEGDVLECYYMEEIKPELK